MDFGCGRTNIPDLQRRLYGSYINHTILDHQFQMPDHRGVDCSQIEKPKYQLIGSDGELLKKSEVPKIDIHKWALKNGVKISEDGKTLTCYKAVLKSDVEGGRYFAFHDSSFEYKIGEFASADLDLDQLNECSNGLHGASLKVADEYASTRKMLDVNVAYLELKVDISDPKDFVVPYTVMRNWHLDDTTCTIKPSNKIRFGKCFVVREVEFKIVAKDINTGEEFDW